MNDETGRTGSLEKRGISVETNIDENVLTESTAKAVRFRAAQVPNSSKTYGYVFNEVDKFVEEIVIPSLAWYQTALHERDKTVHYLGEELDKAETDTINLRNQIQYIEYNGQIKKGIEAGTDDKEMAALMQRLQDSEKTVASLRSQLNNAGVSPVTTIAEYETALEERDKYIEDVTNQYNDLYSQYQTDVAELQTKINENTSNDTDISGLLEERDALIVDLKAQLAAVPSTVETVVDDAQVNELQAYIEQISAQYQELYTRYEEDTASLQAQINALEAEKSSISSSIPLDDNSSALNERIAELEAYIEQVSAQYQELYALYEKDIVNIPQNVGDDNSSLLAERDAHIVELETYIQTITEQYTQLHGQYSELEASQVPSTNNAELGALKVELESEKAKVSRLEAELAQYQEEEEEEQEEKPRIPLLTESKKQTPENLPIGIDLKNLPEGIRADDLI